MAVGISRRGGGGCDGEMRGSSGCSRRVGEGERGQNQWMGDGGLLRKKSKICRQRCVKRRKI